MFLPRAIGATIVSLLISAGLYSESFASVVPWCPPEVAHLTFRDASRNEFAKVELRSEETVCTIQDPENAAGVSVERSMRIEYKGQSIEVPKSCLSGLSFRLDELSLSFGDSGIGMKIIGKSAAGGKKANAMIYTVRGEALCVQSIEGQ